MPKNSDNPLPSKNRSRRVRKKLHLAEFQEFGMHVDISLDYGPNDQNFQNIIDHADLHQFIDDFMEFLETHELHCGGGGGMYDVHYFVAANGPNTLREKHRHIVNAWLSQHPHVISFRVSSLIDAWY